MNANLLYKMNQGDIEHQLLLGVEIDSTSNDAALNIDTVCNVSSATLALLADPFNPAILSQYLNTIATVPYSDIANRNSTVDYGPLPSVACFGEQNYRYDTLGVYLQDQITFNEHWHLEAGLRWSRIESDESDNANSTLDNRSPDNDKLIGRLGLSYRINQQVSLFAGYGQGFQAPIGVTSANQSTPQPSESESWEVGIKWRTANGFSGNLAYFDLTRTNIATADPDNPGFRVQVGEQSSKGVELDFIWQAHPQWLLLGNFAHIDARVEQDNRLREGDQLARVPNNSGRLSLRHQLAGPLEGFAVQVGATYRDEQEITLPNISRVDSYTVFDAQASYAWSNYRLRLSVQNLTDKDYYTPHGFLGLSVVQPGEGRSVYLSLDVDF